MILVGGLGTRLGALTQDCPKPMLPVDGRPFLEHLMEEAVRLGVSRFLLLVGYRADVVLDHFNAGAFRAKERTVAVDVVVEPEPLGTGGALRHATDRLADSFLMLNGDSLFGFNWLDLPASMPTGAVGALGLRRVPDASRYGVVDLGADGRIRRMRERPETPGPGIINGGVYWLGRAVLDWIPASGPVSLERLTFPALAEAGKLSGRQHEGTFIDIGVPEDYARAQGSFRRRRGAVFFDRDGVLNEDAGYTHRIEDFRWRPGAIEAVRRVNDSGRLAFVVTNQAGVAHGHYTEADVRRLHDHMQRDLAAAGAHVDAFRYCPHHPEGRIEAYRCHCPWRKPGAGMLRDLCATWDVDIGASLLLGDRESDLAAAAALGIRGVLVSPETDQGNRLDDALLHAETGPAREAADDATAQGS